MTDDIKAQRAVVNRLGRDNPEGLTAAQVIENIAHFPLQYDDGSQSWSDGYAAFRNQRFAQQWLALRTRAQVRP